jgi:hypothetical protein
MTERLRDNHAFASSDEAEAARLLRLLSPAAPPPALEQRVYAHLGVRPRLGPTAMRFAAAASAPVGVAAIAGLALAMHLRQSAVTREPAAPAGIPSPVRPSQTVPASAAGSLSSAPNAPAASEPAPVPARLDPPSVTRAKPKPAARPMSSPTPMAPERPEVARSGDAGAKIEPTTTPAAPKDSSEAWVAAAPPEEAALVLGGLRALRREHNPGRAGALLGRYLQSFPQGVLVQEALAIAIEAGLARGDRQTAASLAEQYLSRFPKGRFVRLARKATGPQRP